MKLALIASMFLSFSAFAGTCYVRNADLVTKEVTLAKEICINDILVTLGSFGQSKATISYTLDGEAKEKSVELVRPIERRDGALLFGVYYLESNSEGGWCSDTTEASTSAWLVMNKDGSNARVEEIEADVTYTNDNCHSNGRVLQTIKYEAVQ